MSTFLELCQDVARESGTFPTIGEPATTVGATNRSLRVVNWTRTAYNQIQRSRRDWRWLRTDFSGTTTSGLQSYAPAAMGIDSRFGKWIHTGDKGRAAFTIYLTATGQADERFLEFMHWEDFRNSVLFGGSASTTGYPHYISVNDQNELVLYPTPDDTYTLKGRYVKGLQTLSADADIPEMPADFHEAITWKALLLLGQFDEAVQQDPSWRMNYNAVYDMLVKDQTPMIRQAEPLA